MPGVSDDQGVSGRIRLLAIFSRLGMMFGFGLAASISVAFVIASALRQEGLMTAVGAVVAVLLLGTSGAAWQGRDRRI